MSFPRSTSTPADPGGFVLGPDDGDPFWWLGTLSTVKVGAAATRGRLDIVEHRAPAGYAPPRHVHTDQDEVFYVVDGRLTVTCGDEQWQAGAGSLVFLPRAVPHGFSVLGEDPARILLINAPAGFAEVITELGDPATTLTLPGPDVPVPDGARIAGVSEAHGIRSV